MKFRRKKLAKRRQLPESELLSASQTQQLSKNLKDNEKTIKQIFKNDIDFTSRPFSLFGEIPAMAFFINSLANKEKINRDIINRCKKQINYKRKYKKQPLHLSCRYCWKR
ncbi:hypothetical protein ACTNEO_16610 [Gracilibacillus sp. HCP3S3_G5_1]|uniref:hypothetical protein n=1 Tax=unclassified Gracilibacillus TaxID=2625209 RepID=UPI003F8AC455